MTSRSAIPKEVTNPRNVSKAERKKAAQQFAKLERERAQKKLEEMQKKRFPFLKGSSKRKGGKIMVGYKAGGKV
jgi:hypothetical protein